MDTADGSSIWNRYLGEPDYAAEIPPGAIRASIAIDATGSLYVADDRGWLSALNADGAVLWQLTSSGVQLLDDATTAPIRAHRSSPSIGADGVIYHVAYDYAKFASDGSTAELLHAINPSCDGRNNGDISGVVQHGGAVCGNGVCEVGERCSSVRVGELCEAFDDLDLGRSACPEDCPELELLDLDLTTGPYELVSATEPTMCCPDGRIPVLGLSVCKD